MPYTNLADALKAFLEKTSDKIQSMNSPREPTIGFRWSGFIEQSEPHGSFAALQSPGRPGMGILGGSTVAIPLDHSVADFGREE